jgi:hypothetical protein
LGCRLRRPPIRDDVDGVDVRQGDLHRTRRQRLERLYGLHALFRGRILSNTNPAVQQLPGTAAGWMDVPANGSLMRGDTDLPIDRSGRTDRAGDCTHYSGRTLFKFSVRYWSRDSCVRCCAATVGKAHTGPDWVRAWGWRIPFVIGRRRHARRLLEPRLIRLPGRPTNATARCGAVTLSARSHVRVSHLHHLHAEDISSVGSD